MGFEDANALLQGGGSPIIKFARIGDSVTGLLLDAEVTDQTEPSGKVVVDEKSGKPKKQIIYTLQTDLRDPSIEDDDGVRRVFAKWAIRQAIEEELARQGLEKVGLQANGKLTLTHNATKKSGTVGFSDMKLFEAKYERPGLPTSVDAPAPAGGSGIPSAVDLVAKYGQQAVDMAQGIYGGAPNTPFAVIAQATNIPEAELKPFLTGETGPF
jgi:hypothetical protein